MSIRFKCPSCQKNLVVRDELAGKRVSCPSCKKPAAVPAPVGQIADLEALAAAAFGDEPAPAPLGATPIAATPNAAGDAAARSAAATIDLTCPYCDEAVKFPADQAGKQEPCPKCKRIVKVPLLKKTGPKDWREVHKGPSAALTTQPQQLAGAWGTTEKARVSRDALEEADAVIEEVEPLGVVGWIKRGVLAAAVVAVLVFVFIWFTRQKKEATQTDALDRALKLLKEMEENARDKKAAVKDKMPPGFSAALRRSAGEYYVRKNDPAKGREYLLQARLDAVTPVQVDREMLLIRIAREQLRLAGNDKEVEEKTRLRWEDALKEVNQTCAVLTSTEARVQAVCALTPALAARGQETRAVQLAGTLRNEEKPAKDRAYSPLEAQQEGLKIWLKQKVVIKPPDPAREITDGLARTAYAQGTARQHEYPKALEYVQAKGLPSDQFRAALDVSAIACAAGKADEAKPFVVFAVKIVGKGGALPRPDLFDLVRLTAQAGDVEKSQEYAEQLPREYRGWAQLDWLHLRLNKADGEADVKLVDAVGVKDSLPRALAWEAWARHQARAGRGRAVEEIADKMDDKRFRPFLFTGIALGVQDR